MYSTYGESLWRVAACRSGAYLVAFSWLAGGGGEQRLVVIEWANRVINYSETIVYECTLSSAANPLTSCAVRTCTFTLLQY